MQGHTIAKANKKVYPTSIITKQQQKQTNKIKFIVVK